MTAHAEMRTIRLLRAGVSERAAESLLAIAECRAERAVGSCGIMLQRLSRNYGMYGDASNGDEVWAIVRDGRVVTLMLRRSSQVTTPGHLSVDRIEA